MEGNGPEQHHGGSVKEDFLEKETGKKGRTFKVGKGVDGVQTENLSALEMLDRGK